MGLDFNYLHNFKREHLWDSLQGVATFGQPLGPDTHLSYPDGDRYLPLQIWTSNVYEYSHDDRRFSFATSLYFEEEDLIVDFVREMGNEDNYRAPPNPDWLKHSPIGLVTWMCPAI